MLWEFFKFHSRIEVQSKKRAVKWNLGFTENVGWKMGLDSLFRALFAVTSGVGTGGGARPPSFGKCPFFGCKVPFFSVKKIIKIAFFSLSALLKT
jgi:hypothetical protein